MRIAVLTVALCLSASVARATPILTTSGPWLPMPPACECGGAPWNGHSYDGHNHALGFVFETLGLADGLEWMSGSSFTLTEWSGTKFFGETARPTATLTEAGGILSYDDHVGPVFYSNAPSGGAGYFALFRKAISDSVYRLYVAVNDTWEGDLDGQDWVGFMDVPRLSVVCLVDCSPRPPGVPEPASVALFGLAVLGLARRMRRA